MLGRRRQRNESEGHYTILAPKWSLREFRYVPQGVKWVGPKEMDTIKRREEFKKYLFSTNPYAKTVRWFEPAFDEGKK